MTRPADVALVTEPRFRNAASATAAGVAAWYLGNILAEDRLVTAGFARHGLTCERLVWSDPDIDWASYRCAVFRTPWDYYRRFDELTAWLDRAEQLTRFFNPPALVRWNMDKHYLADLEARGVHTVPTRFVERGSRTRLVEAAGEWSEVVIKPAVSGAAQNTHRLDLAADHEALFAELVASRAMLVQPLQRAILEAGETTLVAFDGRYSHAVLKRAKPGDFRVQDDHGGTVHAYRPSDEEIAFCEAAMRSCEPTPAYGRADMIRDNDGRLAIMELELFEPELWLREHAPSGQALADAVVRRLG
ncbi:MAG TPA: hypothetical protein VML75_23085 [Kofleriaceae bacterium]|nr:hypothetical protein [Kofleriaceae bacterium]